MDTKQLVLKRTLEAAGQSLAVDSLDDRLRLQKAIYLIQAAGADLGYRYSWYLKGPYSTSLTQDYFALSEVAKNERDEDTRILKPEFVSKVRDAARVLMKPADVNLSRPQWYELLASLHYMSKFERLPEGQLQQTIRARKPHLEGAVLAGIRHLKLHGLI